MHAQPPHETPWWISYNPKLGKAEMARWTDATYVDPDFVHDNACMSKCMSTRLSPGYGKKRRSEIFNASRHNIVRWERKAATSNTDPLLEMIFRDQVYACRTTEVGVGQVVAEGCNL